jgi:hypothetical protein
VKGTSHDVAKKMLQKRRKLSKTDLVTSVTDKTSEKNLVANVEWML